MGLAILPARLKDQSAAIADILTGSAPNTSREAGSPLAVHADWIDGLIKKYGTGLKREKPKLFCGMRSVLCSAMCLKTPVSSSRMPPGRQLS